MCHACMQEAAHLTKHSTPQSLVLIDELGRATSTQDGIALAWAISEHLISTGAYTLAATHFALLTELEAVYPNCSAWHFEVDTSDRRMRFCWKLRRGSMSTRHYGLLLAPMVRGGAAAASVTALACALSEGGPGLC